MRRCRTNLHLVMPDLIRHPPATSSAGAEEDGPRIKSGVTIGGEALVARTPASLPQAARTKVPPIRHNPHPLLCARHMITTGLLGGSFNPAHKAHRLISLAAAEALGCDEIWWLVSPGNPLKERAGMAPFEARYASARRQARRAPIRVTAIERDLGSPYTAHTVRALIRLYPHRRFVWLMGADNLAQFHRWRDWRRIARSLVIAVPMRPGYEWAARRAPAMGWLRRFVRPAATARKWTEWSVPALVLLKLPLDPTSATAIRAADPAWHQNPDQPFTPQALRDGVTRRPLHRRRHIARPTARSV